MDSLLPASSGEATPGRPRVVVSVTASADGRVALNRSSVLLQDEAAAVWRSLHPAGAAEITAARRTQIESRHHPQAVLEGSGTFVTGTGAPPPALPPAGPGVALLEPSLPEMTGGRWFVVVDGRRRVRWTQKGDADTRLLVLVCRTTPADYLAYLRREQIPCCYEPGSSTNSTWCCCRHSSGGGTHRPPSTASRCT